MASKLVSEILDVPLLKRNLLNSICDYSRLISKIGMEDLGPAKKNFEIFFEAKSVRFRQSQKTIEVLKSAW